MKFLNDIAVQQKITSDLLGNASTASKWLAAITLSLTGDVSGTANIDGSGNISIATTIADNSHNHIISNVDGLQTALDAKLPSSSYTAADVLAKIKTVDGLNSGLDADLVQGRNSATANTANTLVYRDASGNFSAGTITATLSGNASTATKLATARNIALSGDVSGSANFDGSGDVSIVTTVGDDSHTHDTRYYTESEINNNGIAMRFPYINANGVPSNNLGSPTLAEMALFPEQFNNKSEFYDITKLSFQTSSDRVTWTDFPVSDSVKANFLGGDAGANIQIPNGTTYFRITLRATSYVYLNALYMYWSGSGNSTKVKVYKKHDSGSYTQHTNSETQVSSWPGHLYLPFSAIPFTPSATLGTHWHEVFFEFEPTWSHASNPITLYKFQLWGGYPAGRRNLFYTDAYRNATFPANITATTFIGALTGNASTASKWATVRTITLGGDLTGSVDIDGSANVTLTATVAANSVALGTDTTGNYVAGLTQGTGISITGTAGEGWSPTVALSHLGIQSLTDPNEDRIMFWDDSAGAMKWLTLGTNLSILDNTINAAVYTASNGIVLSGTDIQHVDTSTQASVNNSGRTFIQDITLDTYGHITAITSATDADTYIGTVTSVSAGNGLDFTTISSSGAVTLGTPSTLSVSTANGVTATSHTHAITTASIATASTIVARDANGDAAFRALTNGTFASGFAGTGGRFDYGVSTSSQSTLEVDNLIIRNRISVYELLVNQIRATNGGMFVSSVGKIASATISSGTLGALDSIYILTLDANITHGFAVGDLIRARRWISTAVSYDIKMEVTAVTTTSPVTITAKLKEASAYLSALTKFAGMEFVRVGNVSDASRQGSVYLTSDDLNAPYIDIVSGVNAHTAWGTANTIKARLGNISGMTHNGSALPANTFGLWAENAYLSGSIVANSGLIAGWTIGTDAIYKDSTLYGTGITPGTTDDSVVFWAGAPYAAKDIPLYSETTPGSGIYQWNTSAPSFSITREGQLTAKGGVFSGDFMGSTSIGLNTTAGHMSIAIGHNTTADEESVVIGTESSGGSWQSIVLGPSINVGSGTISIGSGTTTTSMGSIFLGKAAGNGTLLSSSIGIGTAVFDSSASYSPNPTDPINIAIGHGSAKNLTTGAYGNIFLGTRTGSSLTNQFGNIIIGNFADAGGNNNIVLGNDYGLATGNTIVVGNASIDKAHLLANELHLTSTAASVHIKKLTGQTNQTLTIDHPSIMLGSTTTDLDIQGSQLLVEGIGGLILKNTVSGTLVLDSSSAGGIALYAKNASSIDIGTVVPTTTTIGYQGSGVGTNLSLKGNSINLYSNIEPRFVNQAITFYNNSIELGVRRITGAPVGTNRTATLPDATGTIALVRYADAASALTGATTVPANGELLIGDGTDYTRATLTAGSNISITNAAGSITIASSLPSHTHGNITNAGYIGSTANLPIITGTGGILQAGSFGTTANTFCQGNDSRLSDARTPVAHVHGNITNGGAIGTTSGLMIKTTTSGVLTTLAAGTTSQYLRGDGVWGTPPDLNYYPTTFTWTNGTTSGPTGSLSGSGMSAVSFGAIPAASGSVSGIVTTDMQVFKGMKIFKMGDSYDGVTILGRNGGADGFTVTITPSVLTDDQVVTLPNATGIVALVPIRGTSVTVLTSAWVADTTYPDYGYRASIAISGVTNTMIPHVYFNYADSVSGIYSTFADTYNGGVYIYASGIPSATVTIPLIECVR